eukprot:6479862-Amphidinium_carterae.1
MGDARPYTGRTDGHYNGHKCIHDFVFQDGLRVGNDCLYLLFVVLAPNAALLHTPRSTCLWSKPGVGVAQLHVVRLDFFMSRLQVAFKSFFSHVEPKEVNHGT